MLRKWWVGKPRIIVVDKQLIERPHWTGAWVYGEEDDGYALLALRKNLQAFINVEAKVPGSHVELWATYKELVGRLEGHPNGQDKGVLLWLKEISAFHFTSCIAPFFGGVRVFLKTLFVKPCTKF